MADILVIDDQDRTIELCRRVMPEHEWHGPARGWADAEKQIRSIGRGLGLVLLDVHFDLPAADLLGVDDGDSESEVRKAKRAQGFLILEALRQRSMDLPVVLMTARDGTGMEAAAERLGAAEYTYFLDHEDIDAHSLRGQVEGVLRRRIGVSVDGPIFWGRSGTMRDIRSRLETFSRGRLPVMLLGPTGSGKSLIARHFVHKKSRRSGKFVSVDLSTLPKDLVASHLFGSVRGAYTGSVADKAGAFEEAHGGTLFIDEVANLTDELQKMLLTVLQERSVTRVGDTRERSVDVKLVVATNEDLSDLVARGSFRADLYMRLNPASAIGLPALIDRGLDWSRLTAFTVDRIGAEGHLAGLLEEYASLTGLPLSGVQAHVGDQAPSDQGDTLQFWFPKPSMGQIRDHRWPGNLREFSMAIENALTLALAEAIAAGGHARRGGDGRPDVVQVRPKLIRDQLMAVRLMAGADSEGKAMEISIRTMSGLNKVAQDVERQYFTSLYLIHQGDFSAMASVLLGDSGAARKVQLRFNQLGLRVRDLKDQIA
jgi:DNA-binding NtrC family response regulator